MNRLLNRTLIYYTVFASLLLALSSPFFYWMVEKLYLDDIDESIMLRRQEFLSSSSSLAINDITDWNRFNRDTRILPDTITTKPKEHIIHEVIYDSLTPEWEPYHVLYSNVTIEQQQYVLMIRLNLVESEDLIKTLTWLYGFVLFALLIVIFFVTRFISNRLWQPFYNTLQTIQQFNIEQHTVPVFASTRISEFRQLNKSLQKLINDNLKAYQSQKQFTENAAHELQTPLAVFQSKLDMLLQDPSLTHNQAEILQSLYEAASRLSRLNKNLLLLAKIENKQFTETETIDISVLINELLPYFSEQALSKNITIKTEVTDVPVVTASRPLIEIMVSNLLLNAITHNHQDGSITIELKKQHLVICNTGSPLSLKAESLFKRFVKFSSASSSSGLGLAIVKQICEVYRWQVSYHFTEAKHCFTISF